MSWFRVEHIDDDTLALSEYRHYEETHSYLLLGRERALLVDTGLGVDDIGREVRALTDLPLIAVLTHAHWDHIGGLAALDRVKDYRGFCVHEAEAGWMTNFPLSDDNVRAALTMKPCEFPEGFSAEKYRVFKGDPAGFVTDGMTIDLGGRILRAIHTPGHSPGHCCWLDEQRGYLFTGDLLYAGRLYMFYPTTDPQLFRDSLEHIRVLKPTRLLPGHHSLDIEPELLDRVCGAMRELYADGRLRHGTGIVERGDFSLQL